MSSKQSCRAEEASAVQIFYVRFGPADDGIVGWCQEQGYMVRLSKMRLFLVLMFTFL